MFHPSECKNTSIQELFNQHNTQVLLVEIKPGGEVPAHHHEVPCTIQILSGSGVWYDGVNRCQVKAGDVYHKQAGQVHGFSGIGTDGLQFTSVSYGVGLMDAENQKLDFALAN